MVNQEQVLEILHAVGEKITEEKLFLTELDNVIGDGDHGINLARGFAEVEKKRPMMEGKDIGTMLKTTGMALVSTVGGRREADPCRCAPVRHGRQGAPAFLFAPGADRAGQRLRQRQAAALEGAT